LTYNPGQIYLYKNSKTSFIFLLLSG